MTGTEPSVTLLRNRCIPAGTTDGARLASLSAVLMKAFGGDAHWQQGTATDGRRITRASLPITMRVVALDIDGPGHQAPPEWRLVTRAKIAAAFAALGRGFAHETRAGFRVVWLLRQPVVILDGAGWLWWRGSYRALCAMLADRFGLQCDQACSDASRIFRAPHATRDGIRQEPLLFGDPSDIAAVDLPAAAEPDLESTPTPLSEVSTGSAPASKTHIGRTGAATGGLGLLERMLDARGSIHRDKAGAPVIHHLDRRGEDAIVIDCPNAAQHAPGRGDSALLVPGAIGVILCQRTACRGITGAAWLRCFTAAERIAAGVRQARIVRYWINSDAAGRPRLGIDLQPLDGGPALGVWRVSAGTIAFDRLFDAADLETPDADDLQQIQIQARGLVNAQIALEVAGERVRRILPAA